MYGVAQSQSFLFSSVSTVRLASEATMTYLAVIDFVEPTGPNS